ncbi:sulfotransferase family protein [Aspergillus saccharolyticus JOP 1030-1]|uniref:NAD dependent epimerase/dehydratase n=1 Tax=Aspergillus saccharolyticus JOP 1030-1 TaxID=1450539 RepID=A0A318ZP40_9EURO|nr:NAD dependent epimerase/dehydratase [Aspergillus saccharolyticus JOP 1030-1]PYH49306.1 NAD dependent epimerase/dehydratase [Aspergillus saccharolyticus JOP 1030-1]
MGQTASAPRPGTQLQVIGAGLPRTGTASFSAALSILLDGPVYHGGTQLTRGPPGELKAWVRILRCWLAGGEQQWGECQRLLRHQLDGYAAITDAPGCQLLPELMALYPDAKVICTVRDPVSWEKSMAQVHSFTRLGCLKLLLLPLPGMRHFVEFTWLLRRQWCRLYADDQSLTSVQQVSGTLIHRGIYERHIAWLEANVPADRVVFVDVRDGWEPLCRALGKEVHPDIPFPRINDADAIARTGREYIRRAMVRWVGILGVAGTAVLLVRRWRG